MLSVFYKYICILPTCHTPDYLESSFRNIVPEIVFVSN